MKKWKKEYEVHQKTVDVQMEEDWQKRMAHGHYCPYCKAEILDVSTCVVTYIVPVSTETMKKLTKKQLFSRANRRVSCPDCKNLVTGSFKDPYMVDSHIFKIINTPTPKAIKIKKGDDYRSIVLKMNGFDPALKNDFTIYHPDDKIGESQGVHAMFQKVIGAYK